MSGRNSSVQQTAHYRDARWLCTRVWHFSIHTHTHPVRKTSQQRTDGTGSLLTDDLHSVGATQARGAFQNKIQRR